MCCWWTTCHVVHKNMDDDRFGVPKLEDANKVGGLGICGKSLVDDVALWPFLSYVIFASEFQLNSCLPKLVGQVSVGKP